MSKKRRKTNFRTSTHEDVKRQKEKKSYGYLKLPKGVKTLKVKEDTRKIDLDFIPYEVTDEKHLDRTETRAFPGDLWYKKPFKTHRDVGAENKTVICRTTIGKKCPICEFVIQRLKDGAEWDEMKDISAKDRNLYAVRPLDSKDHDDIIHVWDMSQFLFQEELNDQLEEDESCRIFPSLEEGKTLTVKFKWKKFGKNKYPETRDITFEDRDEPYSDDILDEVPNLDKLLDIKSYQELHDMFFETESGDDDNKETIVNKPPKKDKSERKKKSNKKESKEEPPKEMTRGSKKGKPKDKTKDGECPEGYEFGKDCEEHNECDDCNNWDACILLKEKLNKKK